jgi:hypothetical protein
LARVHPRREARRPADCNHGFVAAFSLWFHDRVGREGITVSSRYSHVVPVSTFAASGAKWSGSNYLATCWPRPKGLSPKHIAGSNLLRSTGVPDGIADIALTVDYVLKSILHKIMPGGVPSNSIARNLRAARSSIRSRSLMNCASRWFGLDRATPSRLSMAEVEMAHGISLWPSTIENSMTILS